MKDLILTILVFLKINYLKEIFEDLFIKLSIAHYEQKTKQKIRFVKQGSGKLDLIGNINNFVIHETSHLKSNTLIECTGEVRIGKYFHPGRGLTIFSANHNYDSNISIPYDSQTITKTVIIDDFVWIGSNVTIIPGVHIGEGAIIGAGSVVSKDIPKFAIAVGNPARIIKYRDKEKFIKLKEKCAFY